MMASPSAGDVILRYGTGMYTGQVREKKNLPHGRGVLTWPDGGQYEGEWRNGKRHGHGVVWHADGRVFDGEFYGDFPVRGTAMEADGTLALAVFDGRTRIWAGWRTASRTQAGCVVDGWPRRDGGGQWHGTVEDAGGAQYAGELRWLRLCGAGVLTEGGSRFRVEYADCAATLAEGDAPGRMPTASRREVM